MGGQVGPGSEAGYYGSGASGYSGFSGLSGFSGFSGLGISGVSGFSGFSGTESAVTGILRTAPTFNDAQIKSVPIDAPGFVTLVAAPGAGKIIRLLSIVMLLDTSAGAYTGVGLDAQWYVKYGVDNVIPASEYVPIEATLESAGQFWIQLSPAGYPAGILPPLTGLAAGSLWPWSDVANLPLTLADNESSSAYGSGNAANTLKTEILYTITDV